MENIPKLYPTIELQPHDAANAGFKPDGLSARVPPGSGLPLSPSATSQNSQSAPFSSVPPYRPAAAYERSYPPPHQSSASSSSRDLPAKVAIPRAAPYSVHAQRLRSARACEPCRQRKIKCDGDKPVCRQCQENRVPCSYLDVKRVRDQKQLGILAQRVERYERLLRDLETEVEGVAARRIRRTLKAANQPGAGAEDGDLSDSSTSSAGSLTAIDLLEEDLNRSEKTRATGYFGKNSEVSWMQKLEGEAEKRGRQIDFDPEMLGDDQQQQQQKQQQQQQKSDIPIAAMSYHLDDLGIPLMDDVDPYALPPKKLADRFFAAYMEFVHPAFQVVRKSIFVKQYWQFFSQPSNPPRRWLAILNMIFALGCRYCRLLNDGAGLNDKDEDDDYDDGDWNDLVYLNRARKLCLDGNVLFEHTDLQQIQVETLVALYLLALGQINRASNFAGMAFRSALSLGINLRFEDERTHHSSKEARGRLWWSIYVLEHLLTATTGRASCVGEWLTSAPLPIPFEEERFDTPEAVRLFRDPRLRLRHLKLSLFETEDEARAKAQWLAGCEPSPSLFFHCLVDLASITQAVLNKVYSIQGLRDTAAQFEQRVRKYSSKMDSWLSKLPAAYSFTTDPNNDTLCLDDIREPRASSSPFTRERVCLAFTYYSARITISRPCLTPTHIKSSCSSKNTTTTSSSSSYTSPDPPKRPHRHKGNQPHHPHPPSHRTSISLTCLRAACALIDILPDHPDPVWLARFAPWWSILHYIMQATTALLLGLSSYPAPPNAASASAPDGTSTSTPGSSVAGEATETETETDPTIATVLAHTRKALRWLRRMGGEEAAARRAFVLCERVVRRIVPGEPGG
ncbi:C6 zinc finger domain protein [Aspergillus clavatus NRRL 1]|uniref:C6 zinc finger domain protein n=1 Tax=Aspergillus clavatus (strain ATCC 1007 / CBS 513.65 / DSM 816 / NCTC 3887 / NRRL 1 / QM 1276 / 107) TaxID=344612 RepID=A1CG60_ASPCL|nr:C6 zinc finger domain protein [Aspergillus clavatus NRRL 1]EAW10940.1 C6 zinc finger domain protein [Aspergillus clavatus NRRL 1]